MSLQVVNFEIIFQVILFYRYAFSNYLFIIYFNICSCNILIWSFTSYIFFQCPHFPLIRDDRKFVTDQI